MDRDSLDVKIAECKANLELAKSYHLKMRDDLYEASRILSLAENELKAFEAMTEFYPKS